MFAKQTHTPAVIVVTALTVAAALTLLPVLYVWLTGDFPGQTVFYGQTEDSVFTDVVFTIRENVIAIFVRAMSVLSDTLQGIQNFFA